jgi:hypothetical protein
MVIDSWKLVDQKGKEIEEGAHVKDFRGDYHEINGGRPPHKPSSTGRIWTSRGESFPSVCDLKWVEVG